MSAGGFQSRFAACEAYNRLITLLREAWRVMDHHDVHCDLPFDEQSTAARIRGRGRGFPLRVEPAVALVVDRPSLSETLALLPLPNLNRRAPNQRAFARTTMARETTSRERLGTAYAGCSSTATS